MKSNSTKHRTVSTALLSKTQLPKLQPTPPDNNSSINRKLFSDTKSITFRGSNKTNLRERIKTEVNIQREKRVLQHTSSKIQHLGYRKLEQQLKEVNALFKKIQILRQSFGIVSLNEKGEEEQRFGLDSKQVPYDPHLHEMNEQICQIKSQIEQSLEKVFRISKQYPRLQQMIEELLEQHLKDFLVQNGRNGKIAAMKAQYRLIKTSQEKLARLQRY